MQVPLVYAGSADDQEWKQQSRISSKDGWEHQTDQGCTVCRWRKGQWGYHARLKHKWVYVTDDFPSVSDDRGCCFYCCFMLQLQKLYIVCDVALFVIANKSTACHLDSPKEPVLPSKFFLLQDKAMHTWKILFKLMHRRYLNNSEIQVLWWSQLVNGNRCLRLSHMKCFNSWFFLQILSTGFQKW